MMKFAIPSAATVFSLLVCGCGNRVESPPEVDLPVGSVLSETPAEDAGLRAGDKILKVDGVEVGEFETGVGSIADRVLFSEGDSIKLDNGDWLSEDYAFCNRVRALGDVPLLAYVGAGVGHVGHFTYGGPYVERLKAGKL